MGFQSKKCVLACLISVFTLPSIAFSQRMEPVPYNGMDPNMYQPGYQTRPEPELIGATPYDGCCGSCQVGCGNYVDCGCGRGCGGGFYAFYENVIVQPFFTRNTAYFLEDPPPLNNGYQEVPFDWDFSYSPRVELGVLLEDGSLGARTRYWYFDDQTSLNANDPNGDIFSSFADDSISEIGIDGATAALFAHSLRVDVVDIEAAFRQCNWTYSGGLRYAHMEQEYSGIETDPDEDMFLAGHDFEGWGITVAAEARTSSCSGITLFAKVRGSYIYGTSDFFATNGSNDALLANLNEDDLISIGEMQVGIDSRFRLAGGATFVVTLAAEGQYWNNAGTGGPANNAPYDEGNYQNAQPQEADLGFFGLSVGTGLLF